MKNKLTLRPFFFPALLMSLLTSTYIRERPLGNGEEIQLGSNLWLAI